MELTKYLGYGKTKLGLHWTPTPYHAHTDLTWALDACRQMRLGWVTILDDGGGSSLQPSPFYNGKSIVDMLLERDIIPVVRFYASPHARFDSRMEDTTRRLVAKGVRYIFWQNEPEVGATEWKNRPKNWVVMPLRALSVFRRIDDYKQKLEKARRSRNALASIKCIQTLMARAHPRAKRFFLVVMPLRALSVFRQKAAPRFPPPLRLES